jgi:hypothetical protein
VVRTVGTLASSATTRRRQERYHGHAPNPLKALKAKNLWKEGQLDVTFVPRGLESKTGKPTKAVVPEKSNVRFSGISIVRE